MSGRERRIADGVRALTRTAAAAPALVAGAILLAWWLRLRLLDGNDMWWDEAWTVWLARHDLGQIALITAGDVHPPLHHFILHFWRLVAGESPFAVRYASVFFGVLNVALLYRLGRFVLGPGAAVVAALILAVSRYGVWWSQEVKMYTFLMSLLLVGLLFLWRTLHSNSWRDAAWFGIAALGSMLTAYLAGLVLAAVAAATLAWAGWSRHGNWQGPVAKLLASAVVAALTYMPWLAYMRAYAVPHESVPARDFVEYLRSYVTIVTTGVSSNIEGYWALAAAGSVLAIVGVGLLLADSDGSRRTVGALGLVALVVLPVSMYGVTFLRGLPFDPKLDPRYFLQFLPLYALSLGVVVTALARRSPLAGALLLAAIATGTAWTLPGYYSERQATTAYPALARFVDRFARPGDAIVLDPDADWPVWLYYSGDRLPWYKIPYKLNVTEQDARELLAPVTAEHPAIWLIQGPGAVYPDPQRNVSRWLEANLTRSGTATFGKLTATLYTLGEARDLRRLPPDPTFPADSGVDEGAIKLVGVDPLPARLTTGTSVQVVSYWQIRQSVATTPRARLELRREGASMPELTRTVSGFALPGDVPGTVARAQHNLALGDNLAEGEYVLDMVTDDGSERVVWERRVWVHQSATRGMMPAPAATAVAGLVEVDYQVGEQARLTGYALERDGRRLAVTLRWEPAGPTETSEAVFVHLLDEHGQLVAQHDSVPANGASPTSGWYDGLVVADRHVLELPEGRSDRLQVVVGMYNPATMRREPVSNAQGERQSNDRAPLAYVSYP